jgi:colanic acid/amylovoran biosynthesis glycosyltransferase
MKPVTLPSNVPGPVVEEALRPAAPRLRVVYLVSLFPCWSETFIVREIRELIDRGVDVRVVSLKQASERMVQTDAAALLPRVIFPARGVGAVLAPLGEIARDPLRACVDLARLTKGLAPRPATLAKSLIVWWRALALAPRIRRIAPDHLHSHWATYPSTAALALADRLGVPWSFTAHAHDVFLEDHLLAIKIGNAAFAVTISQFNVCFLRERLGGTVDHKAFNRLRVIHCGVRLADFPFEARKRSANLLLAIGRLDEIKGFEHLIDACSELRARGISFECTIIGEGPLRSRLEAQIARLGLAGKVHLPGARRQEQVRTALCDASVFVLPSVVTTRGDRDGIPVALMEAMASGCPVVATTVSGIPELVENGTSGLLAAPADAKALGDSIAAMLQDPERAAGMALRARARVEADFDVRIEARRLLDAFEQARQDRWRTTRAGRP